jgi:hypothetical protein
MRFEMRFKSLHAVLALAVVCLTVLALPALAQDYSFNLRENQADLYIETDGTVRIVQHMVFDVNSGADAQDVVDIGLPNDTYNLSEVWATLDGQPVAGISRSPYVEHGVAVELGVRAIQPGRSGALHVEATVRDLLYQDSKDAEYASLEFSPTWFGSEFVTGSTRLEVNFHFPLGVTAEEPRYHKEEFTSAGFVDDRVVYTWVDQNASGSRKVVFGASFPKKYLAEGVVQKAPAFTLNLGKICAGPLPWILFFVVGYVVLGIFGSRAQKKRKMKYLPPSVAVEGTGVKRGLTAVEAAVLLEAPLNRVMTMILFGLVKKGVIVVESEKPLKVQPLGVAKEVEEKLWYYERRFLSAVKPDGTLADKVLREMVIDLIGDVNKKIAGFHRGETKTYYKDIAARAWEQVEAADTPEVLGERWGDGLEWTMLDDDWDDRTRRVFRDRPVLVPNWWYGYRPWVVGPSTASGPSLPHPGSSGGGTPVTLPTLPGADFANTVVGGIENAANTVVSRVESFTGMVTEKTNPPPKTTSSGGSRSGGRSCACACACAGCACACAGGGR